MIRAFDVAYFAASTDTIEKNTRFAQSLDLDYPVLADPAGDVAEAYGVRMPIVNVASRWTFYIGKDGRILDIDKKVKAATHGQAVAERLEKLKVPRKA